MKFLLYKDQLRSIILLSSILCLSMAANGQSIASNTIEWTVTKAVDQADNSESANSSTFVTNGNKSVDWIQKNIVSHYTVTQVDGTWPDLGQDGAISYNFTGIGTLTGTITFSRSQGQLTIHLITHVEDVGLDFIFQVSSTQVR